jgi:hypothetical protein
VTGKVDRGLLLGGSARRGGDTDECARAAEQRDDARGDADPGHSTGAGGMAVWGRRSMP